MLEINFYHINVRYIVKSLVLLSLLVGSSVIMIPVEGASNGNSAANNGTYTKPNSSQLTPLQPTCFPGISPYTLLIQDISPWGQASGSLGADAAELSARGLSYCVADSSLVASWNLTTLEQYSVIIMASAQDQEYYSNLFPNDNILSTISSWVESGGVLLANLADDASGLANYGTWGYGRFVGGLTHFDLVGPSPSPNYPCDTDALYCNELSIVPHNPEYPVISATGFIVAPNGGPIVNNGYRNDLSTWDVSAVGGFTNLPAGATVILALSDYNNSPVMVQYTYGQGLVVATLATVEWMYIGAMSNTMRPDLKLLANEIGYVTGAGTLAITSVTTSLSSSSIFVGSTAYDTATLVNARSDASGTVDYESFTGGSCNGSLTSLSSVTVSGGIVPNSTSIPFDTAGVYSWRAYYSGDSYDRAAKSPCEQLRVNPYAYPIVVATLNSSAMIVGHSVFDTVELIDATNNAGGNVTYEYFSGPFCVGSPTIVGSPVNVTNGAVPRSISETFNTPGRYFWIANYSGDETNKPAVSECQLLTVNKKASPTISNNLSADSITVGFSVNDFAILSGVTSNAGGTVKYREFNESGCGASPQKSETVVVNDGIVPVSEAFSFSTNGTYSFDAVYSGDANNLASTSRCEMLIVNPKATTFILTSLSSQIIIPGESAFDTSTLSGETINAGGNVTYNLYSNSTCTGTVTVVSTVNVTNDSIPNSDSETFNSSGIYSWRAVYSGDSMNQGANSVCEHLTVASNSISTGLNPYFPAFDSHNHEIYVPNAGSNTVSVINGSTNTITTTISAPCFDVPSTAAFDSNNDEIYVTNPGSGTVCVISGSTNEFVTSLTVGSHPVGIAFDSHKNELFVADASSESVSVINDSTNTVVATITNASFNDPNAVVFDSHNNEVYVTNSNNEIDTVCAISDSTNKVVATITVGYGPAGIAFDSKSDDVYASARYSNTVSVISNSNIVIATITVGNGPVGVSFDPSSNSVYVSNYGQNSYSNTVSVISASNNTVINTITVGSGPAGIAYDSHNNELYVANYGSSTISILQIVVS